MTKFISRFAKDESGATAIEYGLIAALTSNGPDVTETVYAESEFE